MAARNLPICSSPIWCPLKITGAVTVVTQELLGAEKLSCGEVLREGISDLLTMRAPLHCAARLGKVLQLELLLEAGSPVDCLDGHGWTALQVISLTCVT